MKKYIIAISFLLLIVSGCSKSSSEEEDAVFNVYYMNYNNEFNTPISQDDVFMAKVNAMIYIKLETTLDNVKIHSQDENIIEIKKDEKDDNIFRLYLKQSTFTSILLLDETTLDYLVFNLDIAPTAITYEILNYPDIFGFATTYTIDVENESLRDEIQTELENRYTPQKGEFAYTSLTGGALEITIEGNETPFTGTFAVNDIRNFTLYYDEKTIQAQMTEHEKYMDYYYMTMDVTEEFREKYPSAGINEITVTALAGMSNSLLSPNQL